MAAATEEGAKKRRKERIMLPNGATCTVPSVNPINWNTARASMKQNWYVKVNFYNAEGVRKDIVRKNMNAYETLVERQTATRFVIDVLKADLLAGWDPIDGKLPTTQPEPDPEPALPAGTGPHSTLARALAFAVVKRYKYRKRKTAASGSKFDKVLIEVRSYVRHFIATAKKLRLADTEIAKVRRRDVIEILETLAAERKWGYASWNNCKAYLSALWDSLVYYEIAETNPVAGIRDQIAMPAKRVLLTDAQREEIKSHLGEAAPNFLRAIRILFASGAREEELCRLQGKDVDLKMQEFTVENRKGKGGWRTVTKAITDGALPYWQEAMAECGPEDYVFSDGFRPGANRNGGEKFNRWWKRYVKIPLGIEADMYALKHLHTTEIAAQNEQMAADFNSHADTKMNEKYYDQLSEKRKLEIRKRQQLDF